MTPQVRQANPANLGALPKGTRWVGRPTPYGNPWRIGDTLWTPDRENRAVIDLDLAVALHERWVLTSHDAAAKWVREHVAELDDYDFIACACEQPGPCHAHTLAQMAARAVEADRQTRLW